MKFDIAKNFVKSRFLKCLLFVLEFSIVYFLSFLVIKSFYINVDIKALHLDDLHNLIEYIKYPDLISWIIPYHENRMHYRPVFYSILFLLINIIKTEVSLTLLVNFYFYSFITTALYFLARSQNINRIFSLTITFLALIINFNYYEIYQLIGFIEGLSMLLSIIILVLSIKYVKANEYNINKYTFLLLIIYLLLVFTHERYFPMMLLPIIAISYNKNLGLKHKSKIYIAFIIELVLFFLIRYYHLRIWVPRGTDCSSLVENFDFQRSILFIGQQISYLLGFNLGPEYLCGKQFLNTEFNIQLLIVASLTLLLGIIVAYIASKITNEKNETTQSNYIDLFYILYIFLCILQSSLTIRVELRWLLASFVGLMFYITHMMSYILKNSSMKILKLVAVIFFISFVVSRAYLCIFFRDNNKKIFIINEQDIINNFYDVTVGNHDIDEIKSSKILITSDIYQTIIGEEKYHFFDQFDHKISENQIIYIYDGKDKNINIFDYDIIIAETGDLNYKEVIIS